MIVGLSSEEIYTDLCDKIEKLEYMPGDRLSENELASSYKVSRHIVRGALATLKTRRLVEVFPQRGTYVSLIDMEYISDILFMRNAVEQECLTGIFKLPEDSRREIAGKMKQIVRLQMTFTKEPTYNREFYELDNMYHQVLFAAVGRPHVMDLIADPYIHIRRWRNYEVRTGERMDEIIEEHDRIADAIASGDERAAREKLHRHLDTVTRYSKPLKEQEAQYFA